jgi:RND family efflux transporter MFP subunit
MSLFQRSRQSVARFFKTTPKRYTIGAAVLIVVIIGIVVHFAGQSPTAAATPPSISHVTLASVASLSSDTSDLPVTGTVSSLHQATILAQSSGQVTAVYASLGEQVAAGSIIAKLEDSSQAAAVVQAQGSYAAAQASLAQASGTTAANSTATASQASQSAANAQASAVAALGSAYTALDDAVHTKADALFTNPHSSNPTLIGFTVPDGQLVITLQNERATLDQVVAHAKSLAADASASDTDTTIAAMQADVQTISTFLNNLVEMTNEAVPNQTVNAAAISADEASASAARSEVVAQVAALTAAKNAYDAAVAGVTTATNTATGGTQNSIAAAQANVQVALGALDAAQANLEKTIIRSPLSGTIIDLPVKLGNYLSTGSEAAIVSNAAALQVVTYVTASDARTLTVGGAASINGSVDGVITAIAPALDPTTNEIEVDIGITGSSRSLTDGETVTVALTRSVTPNTSSNASGSITIPIAAVKVLPTGAVVLTVSSSTISSEPVTLGTILGDQVTIVSGLTPTSTIVTDARGLSDGQAVIVDDQ